MNLLKEELIANAEAKKMLEGAGKPEEMKYEQKNAYDNLKKFVKIDSDEVKTIVEELGKNKKLRERQIISIANTLPEDEDDLKAIMHKEYSEFSTDEINLILETVRRAVKPGNKN